VVVDVVLVVVVDVVWVVVEDVVEFGSVGEYFVVVGEGEWVVIYIFVCMFLVYCGWCWVVIFVCVLCLWMFIVSEVYLLLGEDFVFVLLWLFWVDWFVLGDVLLGDVLFKCLDDLLFE